MKMSEAEGRRGAAFHREEEGSPEVLRMCIGSGVSDEHSNA